MPLGHLLIFSSLKNAKIITYCTTFSIICYVAICEWLRKNGESTPLSLTTCHMASCGKNCAIKCGFSIAW